MRKQRIFPHEEGERLILVGDCYKIALILQGVLRKIEGEKRGFYA